MLLSAHQHRGQIAGIAQRAEFRHKGTQPFLHVVGWLLHRHAVRFRGIGGGDQCAPGCADGRDPARLRSPDFGKKRRGFQQMLDRRHHDKARTLEQRHIRLGRAGERTGVRQRRCGCGLALAQFADHHRLAGLPRHFARLQELHRLRQCPRTGMQSPRSLRRPRDRRFHRRC